MGHPEYPIQVMLQTRETWQEAVIFDNHFRPMKSSLTECQENTLMKVVVDAKSDKALGFHMVGPDGWRDCAGFGDCTKVRCNEASFRRNHHIHPTSADEFVTMRTPLAD
ncbi:Glutathione reductase (EC 1.8.1.7) [Pseudomonas fluorescens]|nr:Glutathione reductase (EC 1.8.1.7) [Pseudomonas fluorescens]